MLQGGPLVPSSSSSAYGEMCPMNAPFCGTSSQSEKRIPIPRGHQHPASVRKEKHAAQTFCFMKVSKNSEWCLALLCSPLQLFLKAVQLSCVVEPAFSFCGHGTPSLPRPRTEACHLEGWSLHTPSLWSTSTQVCTQSHNLLLFSIWVKLSTCL